MLCAGQLLGDLELLDDRAPQARAAADPAHPHAPVVHLVAAAADDVAVEAHQEADLVGAAPVLGREGVGRQVGHPDLDRAGDDVEQGRLPRLVALGAGQAAGVGPAAVAVHHDRDVARAAGRRGIGGWPGAARVREGRRRSGLGALSARPAGGCGCRARGATAGRRRPARCPRAGAAASLASATAQSPVSSAASSRRSRGRGRRAGRAAGRAHRSAGRDVEGPVRAGRAAARAVVEARAPSRRPRAPAAGRRRGPGRGRAPCGERAQRPGEQEELLQGGSRSSVSRAAGLEHRRRGGVARVVAGDRVAVGLERLDLGDGVEVAPS